MRSINFGRKIVVQNFGAKKLQTKDFEIENLEINVLTQNFKRIKKSKK